MSSAGRMDRGVEKAALRVETVTTEEGLAELRAGWDELLERSRSRCFFLTWEWLSCWWRHLGESELRVATVWRGDELVGIAPFCLAPGARLMPRLELLGSGTIGSDYLDLIVDPGLEEEVVGALAHWVDELGTSLRLLRVPAADSLVARLAERLSQRDWEPRSEVCNVCPYIDLSEHSWDSYLQSLSSSHRYNFRRRMRQLDDDFDSVEFAAAASEEERRRALDALVRLHLERWSDRDGTSEAFPRQAYIDFHHDLTRRALERDWLRLYLLELDGRPAAALYGFLYDDRFLFYQSGFDPDFGKYSVGLVTMGLSIQDALEDGAREYDLLHGDESYKSHWASSTREIRRLEVYPPGAAGSLLRQKRELGQASRRLARSVMPGWMESAVESALETVRSNE